VQILTQLGFKVEKKTKPIDPMSWLYEDRSKDEQQTKQSVKTANQTAINQNIRELYGAKFDKLSLNQQEYILDNQEIMRRITQKVLNRVLEDHRNPKLWPLPHKGYIDWGRGYFLNGDENGFTCDFSKKDCLWSHR